MEIKYLGSPFTESIYLSSETFSPSTGISMVHLGYFLVMQSSLTCSLWYFDALCCGVLMYFFSSTREYLTSEKQDVNATKTLSCQVSGFFTKGWPYNLNPSSDQSRTFSQIKEICNFHRAYLYRSFVVLFWKSKSILTPAVGFSLN